MVKAKLRLLLVALTVLAILLVIFNVHFSSKLSLSSFKTDHEFGDQEVAQLRQRRLSQPFIWHQDPTNDLNGDISNTKGMLRESPGDATVAKEMENVTASKVSTCRNSVQGKSFIADDRGYLCDRHHVISSTGCCNTTSSSRYDCKACQINSGCCKMYEQCISCCMNPDNRQALTSVLQEANALSNILLLSVSDHFELCLAKCRTSSKSVQHENLYINSEMKYCFMKGSPTTEEDRKDT